MVYAQGTDPIPEDVIDPDHAELTSIALTDLPATTDLGSNPETPLTRTFTHLNDYTFAPDQEVPAAMLDNPLITVTDRTSGAVNSNGQLFIYPDPVDLVMLKVISTDGSTADTGFVPTGRPENDSPTTPVAPGSTPNRSAISSEAANESYQKQASGPKKPLFTEYIDGLESQLTPFISSDIRLSISQTDKTALTGENHGDCSTWNQADDDFFDNNICDPPRVSKEIINTLHYLLTPKSAGGAGRDYLKVSQIIDYKEKSKEEDTTEKTGVFGSELNGPHYVNFKVQPEKITDSAGVVRYRFTKDQEKDKAYSHALDISAIDRIRVTTRIQKKGVFSTSTKYRFNTPTPIKVAWQSDEGISHEPLPTISTQELIPQLGVESILDMLGESDALDDPSFAGRPLESIGMGDIARFLGGRLLGQLLNGQDIGRFNFGDTVKDFGILAIAGALNLDPEVIRNAHSMKELEELTGRSWVGQQIHLPSPIQGKTLNEVLTDIGRQRLGELLGVKGYVFANYHDMTGFKTQLGQGLIEERLPVAEHSFEKNTKDEIRQAVGGGRFDLIFKETQASEIDERLGIEVGPTLSFIRTGNVAAYKLQVGSDLFDRTIGKYNISQGADASPLHPYQLYEQLMGATMSPMSSTTGQVANGSQSVGTLVHLRDTLNDLLDPNSRYSNSLLNTLPTSSTAPNDTGISRDIFTNQMRVVQNDVNTIITTLNRHFQTTGIPGNNCQGTLPNGFVNGRFCGITTSGDRYFTTPDAAITARNDFESVYPAILQLMQDAIAQTGNVSLRITATPAADWQTVDPHQQPGLAGLAASVAAGNQASPFSLGNSLPRNNSMIGTGDLFGASSTGNPQIAIKGIKSELDSVLQAVRSYEATYGSGNPAGFQSANRRDEYFNFPPGTLYAVIGGTRNLTALADIGVWTVSQRLTNQDEQVSFRTAINNARLHDTDIGAPGFTPSAAEQQYLADVFLTVHPADEFRRIGRRTLIDRLQHSAEAASVTSQVQGLDVVQDALFYTQRLQIINSGIETIRQAATDLGGTTGTEVTNLTTQLKSFLNPASFTGISGSAITRVIREKKNLLGQLRHTVEENTTLPTVNSRILPALRNIERATMEILEGKELNYKSDIPADISLGITSSKSDGNNPIGGSCDAPNNQLLTTAKKTLGTKKFTSIFGGDDLVLGSLIDVAASGGNNLDDTLRFIGSAKLGDLLELPQATFDTFFGPGIDRTALDDFFYSVGVGDFMARCNGVGSMTRAELITAGKNYISSVSVPALANKLGITMPDWIQPQDIAGMILGNPSDVLLAMGGRQIEERLNFPSGFVQAVVKPQGTTEADRQHNRERSIIEAALLRLDIELPLPLGFTLTDNPVESMGAARIEQILNFPSHTFYFEPTEMYPEREAIVTHLIDYYRQQYIKNRYSSDIANSTAEVSGRERFINGFGIGLDAAGHQLQQEVQKALNEWGSSPSDARAAKTTALKEVQGRYTANLQAAIKSVFDGTYPIGIDFADPGQVLQRDAQSRKEFFNSRLSYLDNTLGIPGEVQNADHTTTLGTTRKWLMGNPTMKTAAYIQTVGEGSVENFAISGLAAGLKRLGVEGHWFDEITKTDNINLIRTTLKANHAPTPTQWSQLFTMFSAVFSINLDEELNFDGGTLANVIAHPSQADEILVDQGVRIFTDQVLGINLSSQEYDNSINIKRVVQAAMYGAFMNPATGRFEAYTFESGVRLNGDLAVTYAMGEINDIALDYLSTSIRGTSRAGEDLWTFLRVPITTIHDAFEGRLQSRGMRSNYMQEATAARQAWDDHDGDPANQRGVLVTADSHRLAAAASGYQPSFGGQNPNDNVWQDLGSIIQSGRSQAPPGATQSPDLGNAQAAASPSAPDQPVGAAPTSDIGSYFPQTNGPSESDITADAAYFAAADGRQKVVDEQRSAFKEAATYIAKEIGFAAMDFGIQKLFDFPAGIIAPGISRDLIEGNPQQRMNAIFYIGAKYALQEFVDYDHIPEWLRPFADFDTIQQGAAFLLNLDHSSELLKEAFSPGGLFSKIQTVIFPRGLFGEINIPEGTFGAIAGLLITGKTADFHIGSADFKGLGSLFNTQSLLHIAFDFMEKWLDIDAGTLWQAYNSTYQVFKAYEAYQGFQSLVQSGQAVFVLADQNAIIGKLFDDEVARLALDPAYANLTNEQVVDQAASNIANNPVTKAAQEAKAAQLQANLIQAGVTLVLFAVGQIFGKALTAFETAIGLPPGTIMQAVGLAATAAIQLIIVGSLGPLFWVGLGIFVLTTLLGFGVVKIRVFGTADGYYPFVGKLGEGSPPKPNGNPPYTQWPSADVLDASGNLRTTSITGATCKTTTPTDADTRAVKDRPADCQLGWFDPRNKQVQKENFQLAARTKIMGLVRDLYADEYSTGVLPANDTVNWSETDYPRLVYLDEITEGPEANYYLGASNPFLQPARIYFNRRAWELGEDPGIATPQAAADITCNPKGNQWGVCTAEHLWEAVHIQW